MSLLLSLVHTIPFFIAADIDGGTMNVKDDFYMHEIRGKNILSVESSGYEEG